MSRRSNNLGLRDLLRHSTIYSIAPIVQRLLALFLVHFYTRRLDTGEYGLVELSDIVLTLMPILVGGSILAGITRCYFLHERQEDRNAVVTGTTLVMVGLAWIGTLAALSARAPLADLLFVAHGETTPPGFINLFIVATLTVPFSIGTRAGIAYLQVEHRSTTVTAIQIAKTLIESALKLWMLFGLGWGVFGFVLSILIGEALAGTVLVGWILVKLRPRFVWRVFKPAAAYALPLVPVALLQLGLHQADRIMLGRLGVQDVVGLGENGEPLTIAMGWLGIYGLGYKVPFLFHTTVLASFMQIWQPYLFGLRGDAQRSQELLRVGSYAAVVLCGCYLPVAVFGREAVSILAGDDAYLPAQEVVPWVAVAYLCYALYTLGQAALMAELRTRTLVLVNAIALVINLSLNAYLIPRFGGAGFLAPAVVTLLTFVFLAAATTFACHGAGVLPFRPLPIVALVCLATAAAVVARVVDQALAAPLLVGTAVKSILLIVSMRLIWRHTLDAEARAGVLALLPGPLRRFARILAPRKAP